MGAKSGRLNRSVFDTTFDEGRGDLFHYTGRCLEITDATISFESVYFC